MLGLLLPASARIGCPPNRVKCTPPCIEAHLRYECADRLIGAGRRYFSQRAYRDGFVLGSSESLELSDRSTMILRSVDCHWRL
jgi:hypothetical protein